MDDSGASEACIVDIRRLELLVGGTRLSECEIPPPGPRPGNECQSGPMSIVDANEGRVHSILPELRGEKISERIASDPSNEGRPDAQLREPDGNIGRRASCVPGEARTSRQRTSGAGRYKVDNDLTHARNGSP